MKKIKVSLTAQEWEDVIGCIYACHAEYCLADDDCNCMDLADKIEDQVPENRQNG